MDLVSPYGGKEETTHHRNCNRAGPVLVVDWAANGLPESLGVILRCGLKLKGVATNVG